ncbi:hypothetical protein C8Q72DRAFT_828949 [Fomitopsis betulina]|nr:hypothetical protein C8Q72DRAFT_828949 [Fomitopsis betulina]
MQLKLSLAAFVALVTAVAAIPAVGIVHYCPALFSLMTPQPEVSIFVGEPIPGVNARAGLASREALSTTVTYCSQRIDSVCGGACTVYTGGATCLNAPDTNCLAATNNVGFCSSSGYVIRIAREDGCS